MKPTEKQIEELKNTHAEQLHLHESQDHAVVTKTPTRAQWQRFLKTSMDKDQRHRALDQLLRDVRVWPAAEDLDRLLDQLPALAEVFGERAAETAGIDQKAESKKL